MTLTEMTMEKVALLPEANVRVVLAMVNEMLRQTGEGAARPERDEGLSRRQAAFKAIMDMRERSPFPADFDYDRARAEALTEKYGHFAG